MRVMVLREEIVEVDSLDELEEGGTVIDIKKGEAGRPLVIHFKNRLREEYRHEDEVLYLVFYPGTYISPDQISAS